MAPTKSSKPANRMAAEIADYNGVPRSTQEYGTFKWTNRSWYAIEDNTPCDYLVKYETRGVARGMIRFARLEAQTNAPISVGELAIRVAALQEAYDATEVSGLVQAKMRLKIGRPWQRELLARGYGKGVSQLFWAKMDDEDGEEIRVGKAPAEDEESEEEGAEEMGEEMDVDGEQLGEGFENNNAIVSDEGSGEEQASLRNYDGKEVAQEAEMDLAAAQLDSGPDLPEIGLGAAADEDMDDMIIEDSVKSGEQMGAGGEQLNEAPENSDSDFSKDTSGAKPTQLHQNDEEEIGEDVVMGEEQLDKASENLNKDVRIEAGDPNQMPMRDSASVETGDDMDVDLEQIYDEEGRLVSDDSTNLADLRLLFPDGNW